MTARRPHPAAARFPLLGDEELRRLADDIAAHGLVHPIVLDGEGLILDGRNRYNACVLAEVEPQFVIHDGDPVAFVLSANVERRHMSTGARAMATAMVMIDAGLREVDASGRMRWKQATLSCTDSYNSGWRVRLNEAATVAEFCPELVEKVIDGRSALAVAYEQAKIRRDSVERHEPAERRTPLPQQISKRADQLAKTVASLQRLADDDRFTSNRERVAPQLRSHLTHTIEVCHDLLDRLTVPGGQQ